LSHSELLTGEEIRLALEQQGGEDVRVMDVKGRLDTIRTFVIASGRSSRHLRKMGDSVVSALKARGLRQAPGFTGIEGDKEDDWMLVDCYNIAVNLMLPATRTALNIEDHWSREEKPSVAFTGDSKEYDARFEELLEQFPVPEAYSRSREDGAGTAEEAGLALDEAHARLADDGVILEPFAMKSILKQARAGIRRGRGVVGGGGVGVAKPQQGRIRRKSVTKNMK
jgi:ribosome-associated protein